MSSIFVAKLDFAVSDEELTGLFEEHGTVVKAHIAKDKETGKPRGFAFVEMSNEEESLKAISALDGRSINGREIVVKLAEDRSGNKPAPRSSGDSRPASRPTYTPPAPKEDSPFQNSGDDSSSSEVAKPPKRGKGSGGKKKSGGGGSGGGEVRENKMSAYKKSGKNKTVEFDDDDDWELEFKKSQKSGWDDEEEEEEF